MYGSVGWALSMFVIGLALDYGMFSSSECGQTDFREKNYTVCFATFATLMTFALIVSTRFKFTYDIEKIEISNGNLQKSEKTEKEPLLIDGVWKKSDPTIEPIKWIKVLKTFATLHYASFLFVVWWFGFGVGLIFCFLFWHLQDIGGSPSIFGIASVITHASEIVAYFFTTHLIQTIGHVKVLYMGLICNVARFLYVSWLKDPWLVLPLEFVQGLIDF